MRIPLIKIHIMRQKTLEKKLEDAEGEGKKANIRATNRQMSQLLHENYILRQQ